MEPACNDDHRESFRGRHLYLSTLTGIVWATFPFSTFPVQFQRKGQFQHSFIKNVKIPSAPYISLFT